MKTPFSSVLLSPFPQPMLQTPHGCLFVSNIEKGEGGGATFHDGRGENSHQGKKSWSLSCVSTTSVHDCSSRLAVDLVYRAPAGRCMKCKRKHHTSICEEKQENPTQSASYRMKENRTSISSSHLQIP